MIADDGSNKITWAITSTLGLVSFALRGSTSPSASPESGIGRAQGIVAAGYGEWSYGVIGPTCLPDWSANVGICEAGPSVALLNLPQARVYGPGAPVPLQKQQVSINLVEDFSCIRQEKITHNSKSGVQESKQSEYKVTKASDLTMLSAGLYLVINPGKCLTAEWLVPPAENKPASEAAAASSSSSSSSSFSEGATSSGPISWQQAGEHIVVRLQGHNAGGDFPLEVEVVSDVSEDGQTRSVHLTWRSTNTAADAKAKEGAAFVRLRESFLVSGPPQTGSAVPLIGGGGGGGMSASLIAPAEVATSSASGSGGNELLGWTSAGSLQPESLFCDPNSRHFFVDLLSTKPSSVKLKLSHLHPHELEDTSVGEQAFERSCDGCGCDLDGTLPSYSCRQCGFDLCSKCFAATAVEE